MTRARVAGSDRIGALALGALGLACILGASRLPSIPGQPIGPAVFPYVIGAALCLCAALILVGIGAGDPDEAEEEPGLPRLALLRLLGPPLVLVAYYLLVERLGFLITGFGVVLTIALLLGGRLLLAVPLAVAITAFVYSIFASLLRVPLPEGLLALPW